MDRQRDSAISGYTNGTASTDPEADRPSNESTGNARGGKEATDKLSTHQFIYLFILDGLGALVLSGGINFAIAYAMYTTQNPTENPIRLFQLPNTLAGDGALTIILQCVITWLLEAVLVNRDLRKGGIRPIGFIAEPTSALLRWFLMLDNEKQSSDGEKPSKRGNVKRGAASLLQQAPRVLVIILVSFALCWPASVGILLAVGEKRGGDWFFEETWTPQIFKGVLGGVLALLTTPLMAGYWLVREGWRLKRGGALLT
ncbi:hypothetical protein HYQ45_018405 [Verticillium longisporum]|uniref:Uncharacterized protein n=1 Tax=Verticillium longisporum TaxID=100787 RepID=A0A0G4KKS2_VERLO|nr:hypothetical protein HYQ45_018405 [Verticillium longisporum]KAG7116035.1 hypothetical protein HYQ44_007188 [Verticillium longisporum]CRK08636.1 hypothetical protein BN1723_008990 [Verticillium longisporum]CRK14377.1 hypothetical protein BN1708_002651 [Verticillium longisporum]